MVHLPYLTSKSRIRVYRYDLKLTQLLFRRWKGDYGGQVQKWFPANFCEEMNIANGIRQIPDFDHDVSLTKNTLTT